MEAVGTAWSRVAAILLVAWAVAGPAAYLVLLVSLGLGRLPLLLAMLVWAVASMAGTVVVRLRAGRVPPDDDPAPARFRTFRQRASLAANAVLLGGGLVLLVAMVVGRVDSSLQQGASPGLLVGVLGGFLLLAAVAPAAVVNALWSLDPRTAAVERAVLEGRLQGDAAAITRARTIAWVAWATYTALAVLLAAAAAGGAI